MLCSLLVVVRTNMVWARKNGLHPLLVDWSFVTQGEEERGITFKILAIPAARFFFHYFCGCCLTQVWTAVCLIVPGFEKTRDVMSKKNDARILFMTIYTTYDGEEVWPSRISLPLAHPPTKNCMRKRFTSAISAFVAWRKMGKNAFSGCSPWFLLSSFSPHTFYARRGVGENPTAFPRFVQGHVVGACFSLSTRRMQRFSPFSLNLKIITFQ